MNSRTAALHDGRDDRSSRTQRVIDDCVRRRTSGESLSNDQVVSSHPDLMPELGEALRKLALVERAVREGRETSSHLPTQVLEPPAGEIAPPNRDSFPGYEITGEIHRGGQGVVYRAVQRATRRAVAIKVMKEGPFAGPADKARFDREVYILGQLNHPNIVTIHDSGEAAGHFYYTMDYISGQALDAYVDDGQRGIDQTLQLFVKICDAVNAAHLRGIIHRDLKPGNIRIDADGEPYVLDFGLAKVAASGAEASLMTMTGQFVGSLPWASPEQAEGSPSKIDVRTDVYSLGVILYRMLTSRFPYEVAGTMRDVLDRIMTAEPARPSTIRKQINDEVETIVLKCLSKERGRRYQSAGELARDVRHYLAGEPIEAKRDSAMYVLRKQLRKYRLPVAIASAFMIVVTVGFVTSLTFWRQAARERDDANQARKVAEQKTLETEQARQDAEKQRGLADASAKEAKQEAAKAEAVNDFLQNMLASADPDSALGREVTVEDLLDQAASEIAEGSLDQQPDVEAAIRSTIGNLYLLLGQYPAAEPHLRAALEIRRRWFGDEHPEVADSLNDLAVLLVNRGDYRGAEPLYRQALAMRRKLLGDEHSDVADSLNDLASLLHRTGDYAGAEPLFHEALAMRRKLLGNEHPDVAKSLNNLARLLKHQGDLTGAEPLYREALAMRRRLLGQEHTDVAVSLSNLAGLLDRQADYAGAEPLYREALAMQRKLLGNEHPDVATVLGNLATLLDHQGDHAGAEPLHRQALAMDRKLLGDEHPSVATSLNNLAICLKAQGDYQGAERLYREALAMRRKLLGDEHPSVASSLNNLAICLKAQADYEAAEGLYREALAMRRRLLGDGHPLVAQSLNNLAACLMAQGEYQGAEPLLRQALAMRRELLGNQHPKVAITLHNLAGVLSRQGDYAQAEPLFREALAILRASLPPGHRYTSSVLAKLGDTLVRQAKFAQAEPLLRESLEGSGEALPQGDSLIAERMSILGASLAGQGRFEEAEPLLLDGYAGLPQDREALERIVNLYEAWGKPQQAAEYRARLQSVGHPADDQEDE